MNERPSDNGVPLRLVVGLAIAASVVARCVAPALPGLAVGIEGVIVWTGRAAALLTLLSATGLVAGIARLATLIAGSPRAPLLARIVAVPMVAFGCLLLLFASFRPLEPMLALLLGISASIVGALSARHVAGQRERRAGALVLGLISSGGLVHVLSRKLTQDASEAANLTLFRGAQALETIALGLDLLALALTCVWLQRRAPRGRVLVPAVLGLSAVCVVLALRGGVPGADTLSVLMSRALDKLGRDQSSLLPQSLGYTVSAVALWCSLAALSFRSEIAVVLAASLAARAALDIPIPALMLELAALYLPFARTETSAPAESKPSSVAPLPDTPPP